jgi:hypothetical protein
MDMNQNKQQCGSAVPCMLGKKGRGLRSAEVRAHPECACAHGGIHAWPASWTLCFAHRYCGPGAVVVETAVDQDHGGSGAGHSVVQQRRAVHKAVRAGVWGAGV